MATENLDLAAAVERRKAGRRSRWGPKPERTEVDVPGPPPGPPGAYASSGPPGPYASAPTPAPIGGAPTADDGSGRKRRKSRWEPQAPAIVDGGAAAGGYTAANDHNALTLSGGLQIQLPTLLLSEKSAPPGASPEVVAKFKELAEVNRRVLLGLPFDERSERSRSPSPEPIYDANGVRTNTRDIIDKEKYAAKRGELIERLIEICPGFTPPPDFKPAKKTRKILIPVAEYPGYNFFGLIIGPRGNTQKKMQQETNTNIAIRGRGSTKPGGADPNKPYDPVDDEPMHVLITGDTQRQVDAAAKMIEELLVPVDEDNNEHKKRQLKELAEINGTLRVDPGTNFLDLRAKEDEEDATRYQLSDDVKAKAAAQYAKDVEMMHGPGAGQQLDNAYSDFLSELGVDKSMARGGAPGGSGVHGARSGLGFSSSSGGSNDDAAKLYVGHLPNTMNAERMLEMFKPFGRVLQIDVIPDRERQLSCKGFAFVLFSTPEEAIAAKALNGHVVEGKSIDVRLKAEPRAPREPPAPVAPVNDAAKLYVAYMPDHYRAEELKMLLQPYGLPSDVRVITDRETGRSRGFGFAQMMDEQQAQAAIQGLNGQMLDGKTLVVRIAGDKPNHNQMNPYAAYNPYAAAYPGYGAYAGAGYEQAYADPAVAAQYAAYYGYAAQQGATDPNAGANAAAAGGDEAANAAAWAAYYASYGYAMPGAEAAAAPAAGAEGTDGTGAAAGGDGAEPVPPPPPGGPPEGAFAVGDPAEAPPPPPPGSVVAVPSPPAQAVPPPPAEEDDMEM